MPALWDGVRMLTVRITPPAATVAERFKVLAENGIYAAAGRIAAQVEDIILMALGAEAPKRTGKLAQSHYAMQSAGGGAVRLQFRNSAEYASFVIEGTAPHEIHPVQARCLAFQSGGGTVFAMKVNHPGTKPNDYPQRAWAAVQGQVTAVARQEFGGMLGQGAS